MFGTIPWSFRSSPEENARPEPVSTTTQVSFSSASASRASCSSDTSSIDIALSRSGRCIRTTATCGRGCSTRTNGDVVGHGPGP